jgi:hypothetical protein
MAETPQSISIVYEEQEARPTIPVNGAYGGPSVDGTIVFAHIYSEFGTLPAMEEHEVGAGGVVDLAKGNVIKRGDLTRKVLATLVLSPEGAVLVGKWLMERGQMALTRRGENKK